MWSYEIATAYKVQRVVRRTEVGERGRSYIKNTGNWDTDLSSRKGIGGWLGDGCSVEYKCSVFGVRCKSATI